MSEIIEHESTALALPGDITPVSLVLPAGLGRDDITRVFERLEQATESVNWWRGDALIYALENLEGDDRTPYVEALNNDSSLRVYKSVAEAFPPEHRYARNKLEWSGHREFLRIEDPQSHKKNAEMRWKFAQMAAEYGWNTKRCHDRALAWNKGDAGAITQHWVPTEKGTAGNKRVTPDPEDPSKETQSGDNAVFDQTGAGEAVAQESAAPAPVRKDDASTPRGGSEGPTEAGQKLLDAVARVEGITPQDEFDLMESGIRATRVMAAGQRLIDLATYMDPSLKELGQVREENPTDSVQPAPLPSVSVDGVDPSLAKPEEGEVAKGASPVDTGSRPASGRSDAPSVSGITDAEATATAGGSPAPLSSVAPSNVAPVTGVEDEDIPPFLDRRPNRPGSADSSDTVQIPHEGDVE